MPRPKDQRRVPLRRLEETRRTLKNAVGNQRVSNGRASIWSEGCKAKKGCWQDSCAPLAPGFPAVCGCNPEPALRLIPELADLRRDISPLARRLHPERDGKEAVRAGTQNSVPVSPTSKNSSPRLGSFRGCFAPPPLRSTSRWPRAPQALLLPCPQPWLPCNPNSRPTSRRIQCRTRAKSATRTGVMGRFFLA